MKLHHVQISMPSGGESEARNFYQNVLGMQETEKPSALADRGGCWFRSYSGAAVVAELHLGVETPFMPAKKAHPGLVCESLEELERVAEQITDGGYEVSWAERDTFAGYIRFHARDGFGNRIEIMTPVVEAS